jgi:hypothetical protein
MTPTSAKWILDKYIIAEDNIQFMGKVQRILLIMA